MQGVILAIMLGRSDQYIFEYASQGPICNLKLKQCLKDRKTNAFVVPKDRLLDVALVCLGAVDHLHQYLYGVHVHALQNKSAIDIHIGNRSPSPL